MYRSVLKKKADFVVFWGLSSVSDQYSLKNKYQTFSKSALFFKISSYFQELIRGDFV